jgi:hypothetical protein
MPLLNISKIEPVAPLNRMNEYEPRTNFEFYDKQSGQSRQNQTSHYKSHNQIVFMERSVQEYLGKHLNIYG